MPNGITTTDLLRMMGSMALVFAAMASLLWALRRMHAKIGNRTGWRRLNVIEILSLNARHKVALLKVDGMNVLVGVSPAQLTALGQWPAADSTPALATGDRGAVSGMDNHA